MPGISSTFSTKFRGNLFGDSAVILSVGYILRDLGFLTETLKSYRFTTGI